MESRAKIRKIKWSVQEIDYATSTIPERANEENVEEEIIRELKKISRTEEREYLGWDDPSQKGRTNTHIQILWIKGPYSGSQHT